MTWSNEYLQVTRFRIQGSAKKHHAWKAAWSCSITSAGNVVCLKRFFFSGCEFCLEPYFCSNLSSSSNKNKSNLLKSDCQHIPIFLKT